MKHDEIEVLAPAGSPAIARAVVGAGADAIYFAGNAFGARAYAPNFTRQEAAEMLDFVHLHRKKAYLTVNTLLKIPEMERQLYDDLQFYYEAGVDAVLVQDFGVLMMLRKYFPDLPIHASTQMNIASRFGAEFVAEYGVKRIVAARELSLAEIRTLCGVSVEIEVFVHGALCVCYSGQCLMSSFLGGRSGNRGRCAQPCRLPYGVLDGRGKKLAAPGKYMLSPKDLCGVAELPALIEAGVRSLKIEGRMKQAAYAATVTSVYRKYVDLYLEQGKDHFTLSDEDMKLLLASGSRNGFTNAYFFVHNSPEMMSFSDSSHGKKLIKENGRKQNAKDALGKNGGQVVEKDFLFANEAKSAEAAEHSDKKMSIAGRFTAKVGDPLELTVYCIQNRDSSAEALQVKDNTVATVFGTICEQAQKQPVSEAEIRKKLNKTGNSPFQFTSLTVEVDADAFIPLKEINRLRREALEKLFRSLTVPYHRTVKVSFNPFLYAESSKAIVETKPTIWARICTKEQLEAVEKNSIVDEMIMPIELFKSESSKHRIIELPIIFHQEMAKRYEQFVQKHRNAEYEASSYDALGFLQKMGIPMTQIHAGYRLYMLSDRTREAFRSIGIIHGSIPLELSEKELIHRDNRQDQMLIYGRIPLMYTANCVAKNIGKCAKPQNKASTTKQPQNAHKTQNDREYTFANFAAPHYFLQDRKGKSFPVTCDCTTCTNIIYNTVPTDLIDKYHNIKALQPEAIEIAFTTESRTEAEAVLKRLQKAIEGEKEIAPPNYEFTRGHFTKSIE